MKVFREQGAAIVFVSHHLPAVAQLCDNVLFLDQGSAVQLGPPVAVIREYCSGGDRRSDEQDVVITTRLNETEAAGGGFEIEPGDRLDLAVTIEFRRDVDRATIGVVVWDVTRELYVYGASSEFVGVPPIHARRGDIRTFSFSFDAHLTRGLYAIEVNVVDPGHKFLGIARGITHFQVVEQVSYDGVANLYLSGREGAAVHDLREGRHTLGRTGSESRGES
jgi:hypothetical protein